MTTTPTTWQAWRHLQANAPELTGFAREAIDHLRTFEGTEGLIAAALSAVDINGCADEQAGDSGFRGYASLVGRYVYRVDSNGSRDVSTYNDEDTARTAFGKLAEWLDADDDETGEN